MEHDVEDEIIKNLKPPFSLDDWDAEDDDEFCPPGTLSRKAYQRLKENCGLKEDDHIEIPSQDRDSPEELAAWKARMKACDDWWDQERKDIEARAEQSKRAFREAMGRGGMRAGDWLDATFIPYPVERWTLKELKNRIAYLKRERGWLLGKPGREGELARNHAKLSRYTTELFKRYSTEGQRKTRDEFNRLRRSRRKIAKQRKIAALMRAYKEKKLVERLAAKVVKILGE